MCIINYFILGEFLFQTDLKNIVNITLIEFTQVKKIEKKYYGQLDNENIYELKKLIKNETTYNKK